MCGQGSHLAEPDSQPELSPVATNDGDLDGLTMEGKEKGGGGSSPFPVLL